MDLREKILAELRLQNEINLKEINRLKDDVTGELLIMNSGTVKGPAKSASNARMQASAAKKARIEKDNIWISEMLSKYK